MKTQTFIVNKLALFVQVVERVANIAYQFAINKMKTSKCTINENYCQQRLNEPPYIHHIPV